MESPNESMEQTFTKPLSMASFAARARNQLRDYGDGIPVPLILFTSGIWLYFALPIEGSGHATAIFLIIFCGLAWLVKSNNFAFQFLSVLIVVIIGYGTALVRTHSIAAPFLPAKPAAYDIEIVIDEINPLVKNRIRYSAKVVKISKISKNLMPSRIRVTITDQGARFRYGERICLRAVLKAPGGPVRPGGYDFGLTLWFKQIGGTGFAISRPRICTDKASKINKVSKIANLIAITRQDISNRLDQHLDEPQRAIAKALILGDRGSITNGDNAAFRKAGLGHLLAISGLHMAMFAGTLFFLIRLIFALSSHMSLNHSIKKWAAIAAFFGGTIYFLISGQSIPTQRAYIMISIILLAVVVDRPALTMRNVILAATIILIVRPESLLSPGFQMSFAAVTALIAGYQFNLRSKPFANLKANPLLRPLYYIVGVWLSSIIAGLATAPFALYHFHEISYMGPIGNILAIPIFSFLIMPLAVLSLVAMPIGIDELFMTPLSFVIELLLTATHWTASFEPAVWRLGAITQISLFLFIITGIILCFKKRPNLILCCALLVLGVSQMLPSQKPDIYVNRAGGLFVVRNDDAALHAPEGRKANYVLSKWLKVDGDLRTPKGARGTGTVNCDDQGCAATIKGLNIVRLDKISGLTVECQTADILIYRYLITKPCKSPSLILTDEDFRKYGTHAIYLNQKPIRIVRAFDHRNKRIWSGRWRGKNN